MAGRGELRGEEVPDVVVVVLVKEVETMSGNRTLEEEEEEGGGGVGVITRVPLLLEGGIRAAGSTAGNTSPLLAIAISFMA